MITVDQLTLINLVPRSHHGCCVLAAICFTTGTNYFDVEEVVQREQPAFRPEVKGKGGVNTDKLLGKSRRLFGYTFTSLDEPIMELSSFLRRHPTGTFIVRLLESGIIRPEDLARKYASELWANEIMLLAYYIACVNIETTYQAIVQRQQPGEFGSVLPEAQEQPGHRPRGQQHGQHGGGSGQYRHAAELREVVATGSCRTSTR